MNHYFNNDAKSWPVSTKPYSAAPRTSEEKSALVDKLQDTKTEYYVKIVEEVATARPGVLELMDAALADPSLKVIYCNKYVFMSHYIA